MQNWNNILQSATRQSAVALPARSPSRRRYLSVTTRASGKRSYFKPIFEPFKAQPILALTFFAGAY